MKKKAKERIKKIILVLSADRKENEQLCFFLNYKASEEGDEVIGAVNIQDALNKLKGRWPHKIIFEITADYFQEMSYYLEAFSGSKLILISEDPDSLKEVRKRLSGYVPSIEKPLKNKEELILRALKIASQP